MQIILWSDTGPSWARARSRKTHEQRLAQDRHDVSLAARRSILCIRKTRELEAAIRAKKRASHPTSHR